MKTFLSIALTVGIFISCQAREKNFKQFYRHYKHESGMINFMLPSFILNLAVIGQEEEIQELAQAASGIRVLIQEEYQDGLHKKIDSYLPASSYKTLMYVKDGSEFVNITAKIENNLIREIVMVVIDEESFVAIQLSGRFSYDMLQNLIEHYNA